MKPRNTLRFYYLLYRSNLPHRTTHQNTCDCPWQSHRRGIDSTDVYDVHLRATLLLICLWYTSDHFRTVRHYAKKRYEYSAIYRSAFSSRRCNEDPSLEPNEQDSFRFPSMLERLVSVITSL